MKQIISLLILLVFCRSSFGAAIAQWKMNDDAATATILDAAGSYNGTISDITGTATSAFHSASGITSTAMDLDGTDDYIYIADAAAFTPAGTEISISAWIYIEDRGGFSIINKIEANKEEWAFGLDASDYLTFEVWDQSETTYIGRYFQSSLLEYIDSWIHVVATYDGGITCASCKLYLHGTQVDDQDFGAGGTFAACEDLTSEIWVGRKGSGYTDCRIDNIIIYDAVLTPSQVDGLYNEGAGTEEVGLSSYASSGLRSRWADGYRYSYRNRYKFE